MWSAFKQWCADRDLEVVSHAMFGRLARWRKNRIGGTVWYLDCKLAEGYADLTPARRSERAPTPRVFAELPAFGLVGLERVSDCLELGISGGRGGKQVI